MVGIRKQPPAFPRDRPIFLGAYNEHSHFRSDCADVLIRIYSGVFVRIDVEPQKRKVAACRGVPAVKTIASATSSAASIEPIPEWQPVDEMSNASCARPFPQRMAAMT